MRIKTLLLIVFGALASCQSPLPLLRFPSGQAPLNEIFSFEVELVDGPAESVSVNADMPAHGHGMITEPVVIKIDETHYRVDGMMLHMPGYWEIYVEVSRNGQSERFMVPLTLEAWQ
jgi:hypothetical protein